MVVIRDLKIVGKMAVIEHADSFYTVNQQILACYYIWRIWRIVCFR